MDTNSDEHWAVAHEMYEMFFLIGILCTLLTFSLIVTYLVMKSLRSQENSILFQILLIQFAISLKYLITGIAFKMNGSELEHSPINLMDFGIMPYG
jgi:cytochrome bd-type quinol oxidase subunit 1